MKKLFINIVWVIIFFLFANMLWGQNSKIDSVKRSFFTNPILSTEIYALYPHYFIKKVEFNYGFGGAITAQFKRTKYTLGFNYSTKNYYYIWYYVSSYYLYKTNYYTNYYNIPFSISFPLFNKDFKKKNDFIIGVGMIWNIPRKYEEITTYNHISPYSTLPYPNPYKISKSDLGVGKSFQLLLRYQRRISKTFDFYFSGFCYYKFSLEYEHDTSMMAPWSPSFSEDRLFLGINTGFELYYKR